MRDLHSLALIKLKAVLFLLIGLISCGLLLLDRPTFRTAALLGLAIWSFCRLYYFLFYVIERYLNPEFKFTGIFQALRFFMSRR